MDSLGLNVYKTQKKQHKTTETQKICCFIVDFCFVL